MDNEKLLPSYGPLNIKNIEEFLDQSRQKFAKKGKLVATESIKNYEVLMLLGHGSFAKVYLFQDKETKKLQSGKVINIVDCLKKYKLNRIKNEKYLLERLDFPFIVKLIGFAYDSNNIYFFSPYYSGLDLLDNLRIVGKFKEHESRFFAAQIVLCLEYLHYLDIVFRDLKLENIVLDHTGYIKLIDFGFAKIVKERTYTICGTSGYIAPEQYFNKGYGKTVDWWSLGILLFELSHGRMPSFVKYPDRYFRQNEKPLFKSPSNFSKELSDLINKFLQIDLTKRLGNLKNGASDIKDHAWFRPIIWLSLLNRNIKPPYLPKGQKKESKVSVSLDLHTKDTHGEHINSATLKDF